MTKIFAISFLLLPLLTGGCLRTPEISGFTYRYSLESAGNYKAEFQLNPDSTYMIGLHDYFFDRFEGKKRPQYCEGKLTADEYRTFRQLIGKSRLEKMKDSYGFDHPHADGSIVYMLELERGNQTKFVIVNGDTSEKFSRHFNRLILYSAQFIDERSGKAIDPETPTSVF